jgi:multiple sugar transport system permease protein
MANTDRDAGAARAGHKSYLSQTQAACLLLLPFLAVYALFLVYPFVRGVWISLHDWNLLEVAFNPDAKEFVGFRNYERVMWGSNIEWGAMASPLLQALGLIGIAAGAALGWTGRASRATALALCIASGLLFLLPGFHPGEEGRWYDRRFWPTVGNTIVFVGLTVPGVTLTALVLAAAMNRETRAMGALRTLFFLSQVLSVTVVTLIWQIMFSPRQGLIANITTAMGGTPINWLTDEQFAMAAIVIATIWWSLGIAMILFLAGLQDISKDLYEAAALDNATGAKAFWHITLPNLKRTVTLVVILQIILHFQVFGQSHLMTQGGPNDTTQVLVRYIYQTGFRDSELGRASAMAVFLFVIMGSFSVLQFLVGREKE